MTCAVVATGTTVAFTLGELPDSHLGLAVIQQHSFEGLRTVLAPGGRPTERLTTTTELLLGMPERLASALRVPEAGVIAVFGAGPDVFASSLADRVGPRGLIYSLELSDDLVGEDTPPQVPGYVRMRHGEDGHLPFGDQCIDVALWAFAIRTLGHVASTLSETRRVLRPGGRIAIVDWIRQEETCGPRRDDRVSAATCERYLAASGFGLIGQQSLNRSHYLVVGRRPFGNALGAAAARSA